jgi:hypothetical protein
MKGDQQRTFFGPNNREFEMYKRISSVSTILKEVSHLLVVDLNHLDRNFIVDCPLSLCLKIKQVIKCSVVNTNALLAQ